MKNTDTEKIKAYRTHVSVAIRDKSPRIEFGTCSAKALLRGVHPAHTFKEGQNGKPSLKDICTGGIQILGGTGSGKSYSGILPTMGQLMRISPTEDESAEELSITTYDPKAMIHNDAIRLARSAGWESRNIGTKPGEFGFDLFDGMSPALITSMISEGLSIKSRGQSSSDPFWRDADWIWRYCSTVLAQCYECTDEGEAKVKATQERIYSFVGVREIAMSCIQRDGYLFRVVETIMRNFNDPALRPRIAPFINQELIFAIEFLRNDVLTRFRVETVQSVLMGVGNALNEFCIHEDIRARFGAASSNILSIDRLWDNRTVTNFVVSKQEFGALANCILVIAKVRQYHWASKRLQDNPKIADVAKHFIFIDEAQEVVQKGSTYSEANVINMSRAYGVSFIIASQTVSALEEALGSAKACENMLGQLRGAKIYLATTDTPTINDMHANTGKTLQQVGGKCDSRVLHQKNVTGSTSEHIPELQLDPKDIFNMSHPMIHGRVEPIMNFKSDDPRNRQNYEMIYTMGDQAPINQGLFTFGARTVSRDMQSLEVPEEELRKAGFTMEYIFPDLQIGLGEAVIVFTRANLIKYGLFKLSHQHGQVKDSESTPYPIDELSDNANESEMLTTQRQDVSQIDGKNEVRTLPVFKSEAVPHQELV